MGIIDFTCHYYGTALTVVKFDIQYKTSLNIIIIILRYKNVSQCEWVEDNPAPSNPPFPLHHIGSLTEEEAAPRPGLSRNPKPLPPKFSLFAAFCRKRFFLNHGFCKEKTITHYGRRLDWNMSWNIQTGQLWIYYYDKWIVDQVTGDNLITYLHGYI